GVQLQLGERHPLLCHVAADRHREPRHAARAVNRAMIGPAIDGVSRLTRSTQQRFTEAMMYLIWEIAIGILAGFLAGKIMRGRGYGVLMDLLLGLVGAVVGGFVFGLLGLHGYGLVGQLVVATAGAVMLIWLVRRL